MGFLKPETPKVKPLPMAPRRDDTADAAEAERRRIRAADGFASTIATSPLGLVKSNALTTRSLLGFG